jgi:hypothetical protein
VLYTPGPLNASADSVVLRPPGWLSSENANTITASATAMNPVR